MSVPAVVALYTTLPGCPISSPGFPAASAAVSSKLGGLSCLFSPPPSIRAAASGFSIGDETTPSCSFSCSPPSLSPIRLGRHGLVRNSLGSCSGCVKGLTSEFENVLEDYVEKLLSGAKSRHKIFNEDEIHDIHGLRLILENKGDCFVALEIVHELWPRVTGRFRDYITIPKSNGYQSLHTVVFSEDTLPLEVQIRTREMHLQAEFGIAAHWRYKEGDCQISSFVPHMVEWVRWVVTWQCESMSIDFPSSLGDGDSIRPPCPFPSHSDDCPYSYSKQCNHKGLIFVILLENEKMSVQEFPPNSTVKDLLERIGRGSSRLPAYGFAVKEELRPRVNTEPVSNPGQKLRMGDVVELIPAIPNESLTECREEIQRMYEQGPISAAGAGDANHALIPCT